MSKIAFMFPGQGSQAVGMGRDFYDASPTAKTIFERFDAIVTPEGNPKLSEIIFNGPEEPLRQTQYTQPAILATSLAALALFGERLNITPVVTAGHSLGEYGALFASGAFDLDTAARLIQKRAALMQTAPAGAMSAVLGLAESAVETVLHSVEAQGHGPVRVANYNSADQLVISGAQAAVEAAGPLLQEAGAKRVIPLPVGGAFHSPLMEPAAREFETFLAPFIFQATTVPVITNVDAQPTQDADISKQKLAQQIDHSVQWTRTMEALATRFEIDTLIEFGPGRVLCGLAKKAIPQAQLFTVSDMASLEKTVEALAPLHV